MHAVIIHALTGDPSTNASLLAQALGVTAYEARSRVQIQDGGPSIVATFPDEPQAQALAARLREVDMKVLVCEPSLGDHVSSFAVRTFEITDASFIASNREGERRQVEWESFQFLLRGSSIAQETTRTTVEKKKFSAGLAIATGGMMMRKKTKTEQVSRSTNTENFIVAYSRAHGPLSLRESSIDFTSLGAKMQPSRMANFNYLTQELRKRASSAIFDDRLLRRAVQQQILGPSLDADEHLDFALALIVVAYRVRG